MFTVKKERKESGRKETKQVRAGDRWGANQ
jgi:hypothetical protein